MLHSVYYIERKIVSMQGNDHRHSYPSIPPPLIPAQVLRLRRARASVNHKSHTHLLTHSDVGAITVFSPTDVHVIGYWDQSGVAGHHPQGEKTLQAGMKLIQAFEVTE